MVGKLEEIDFVLFYDGECGFCNRSVQFILDHEQGQILKFSSLQSDIANKVLATNNLTNLGDTMVFYSRGKAYTKSTGALMLVNYLKWYLKPLLIFWMIPAFLRNIVYDLIAKRRKNYFRSCKIISNKDLNRFLS
jgi:predicted DCC family thiol-disulfide oxidoreductase YuxK